MTKPVREFWVSEKPNHKVTSLKGILNVHDAYDKECSGTLHVIAKEDHEAQIKELVEAAEKFISSVESDQMICDQDGSKLGCGWAFVEDIKEAREIIAKFKDKGG